MHIQPAIIAKVRRIRAADCDRGAQAHGPETIEGANYERQARYWRAAAALAERGDTNPRPAIHQIEGRADGRIWALVYRSHPLTGVADCLAVETFTDFPVADEWGRLHAEELNTQPSPHRTITAA